MLEFELALRPAIRATGPCQMQWQPIENSFEFVGPGIGLPRLRAGVLAGVSARGRQIGSTTLSVLDTLRNRPLTVPIKPASWTQSHASADGRPCCVYENTLVCSEIYKLEYLGPK